MYPCLSGPLGGRLNCAATSYDQAIMTVGGVFKATIPDESDEERRELER